jgi:hypothetical protein
MATAATHASAMSATIDSAHSIPGARRRSSLRVSPGQPLPHRGHEGESIFTVIEHFLHSVIAHL